MILCVTDRAGQAHALEAEEGWRVMEIIRDHAARMPEIAIKAECGGALSCATCHVYVGQAWQQKLPAMMREEEDMLDAAFGVEENSRLSCQIIMTEELDGLCVTLAPGSEP